MCTNNHPWSVGWRPTVVQVSSMTLHKPSAALIGYRHDSCSVVNLLGSR